MSKRRKRVPALEFNTRNKGEFPGLALEFDLTRLIYNQSRVPWLTPSAPESTDPQPKREPKP